MIKHTAFLVAAAMSTLALAQEPAAVGNVPGEGPVGPQGDTTPSAITIDGELLWTTAYMSDGYVFRDEGLTLQPQITVAKEMVINDDLTLVPWFNVWANVTDEKYNGGDYFDELDLSAGVDFVKGPFTFGLQYLYYVSPVDSFDDLHEIGAGVKFDDSDMHDMPFAFNPYATLYTEVIDKAGPEGTYIELGIEPSYTFKDVPVTITVPVTTAININDFYFDSDGSNALIGYVSVGCFGQYDINDNFYVSAGVEYYLLTADSTDQSNDGDCNKFVASVAVGFSY